MHAADHDPLTLLPSRTGFLNRLDALLDAPETAHETRVGLCYVDLDGFKIINDTLGHDTGDEVLRAVAGRLSEAMSPPGRLVARIGGDQFMILVEHPAGLDEVAGIAETALAAVRQPVRVRNQEITLSASAAVVHSELVSASTAEIMKAADTTLDEAKSRGRNQWVAFDPDRHAQRVSRYELAARLPGAIRREEFVLEYQPLVRLSDEVAMGAEALVRWNHPEMGRLLPDRFITLAEDTGDIAALGLWVLHQACAEAAQWQQDYPDRTLTVSVNVSPLQIREPRIVADVRSALAESGLAPDLLQLELTEGALLASADDPLNQLRALADLGVRIAIDDFGTGYSSLAYLRNLPVHVLKLAGPFVAGLDRPGSAQPVDAEIVRTVIRLAHALRQSVTAEGVETAGQATWLRELDCDYAQGWYYARACPPAELPTLLADGGLRVG